MSSASERRGPPHQEEHEKCHQMRRSRGGADASGPQAVTDCKQSHWTSTTLAQVDDAHNDDGAGRGDIRRHAHVLQDEDTFGQQSL